MYIKHIILIGVIFGLCGCIGENPGDTIGTSNTPSPPTSTPTTSTNKPVTPGTPGVEPAIYQARTTPSAILQTYFQEYAEKNSPLDKRDEYVTKNNIAAVLGKLTPWSKAMWKDQHGTTMEVPPNASNVRIVFDQGGSVLAADGDHIVHNLELNKETGLYIPAKTSVLATKIDTSPKSWIDVRGRLGSAQLDMDPNSIIDLTAGYGLVLENALSTITYDDKVAQTGILELRETGELRSTEGYFLLHKAEVKGNLGVNAATFNFQTRHNNATDNIGFFHTGGKIHPLAEEEVVPDIMMTVKGPFQFKAGAKIELFFNNDQASRIVLEYPFSMLTGQGEPVIEGVFSFVPKTKTLEKTSGDGIIVMESNTPFPAALSSGISQLLEGNIVLGKQLSLAVSDDRKKIYLKISDAPSSGGLKASLPMQRMITAFRQGELKSELWQRPALLTRSTFSTTQFIMQHAEGTHLDTSTRAHLLELKHVFNFEVGNLVFMQACGRAQIYDSIYRFLPQAHEPFWMMQHKVAVEKALTLGSVIFTPSIGIDHCIIPTTLFQKSFNTMHPEISLKSGVTYSAESTTLELNMLTKGIYQSGWGTRNDQNCSLDTGMNISLRTPTLKTSAGVLNPIGKTAEVYLSFAYDL